LDKKYIKRTKAHKLWKKKAVSREDYYYDQKGKKTEGTGRETKKANFKKLAKQEGRARITTTRFDT